MKLFQLETLDAPIPGVELTDGTKVGVPANIAERYDSRFLRGGGIKRLADWVSAGAPGRCELPAQARFTSPIVDVPNIIAIGLNYKLHALESGMKIPEYPIVFAKHTASLSGPNDDVVIPRGSEKTDWEVELAVIIGKEAYNVRREEALGHVAGYAVMNDLSERYFQLERGSQWNPGKGCPTFSPLGPYLVTTDEITDPQRLKLWLELNGERVQSSTTADMIFPISEIVSFLSTVYRLLPGDVITTGTPAGVGLGMNPPRFLKPGDKMRVGIDGLGEQSQIAVSAK